jgi:GT2 family glycosyltransferase
MNVIVCPVRNGLHYTREAMKTFLAQDVPDLSVVFIDNASTDGTTDWLKTQDCFVFHNTTPRSVAASWNAGLRWAFEHGAETCLVVNNDVLLRPDTYRLLSEDGGLFVTAVASDDPDCIRPVKGPTGRWEYAEPDPDAKRPHPTMSCFLMRRECWDRVGPFDEAFKGAFVEDQDYHVRMHKCGITAYCIDLAFYHIGSSTIKECGEAERVALMQQAGKNREYFFQKWGMHGASEEYYAMFKTTAEAVESQSQGR